MIGQRALLVAAGFLVSCPGKTSPPAPADAAVAMAPIAASPPDASAEEAGTPACGPTNSSRVGWHLVKDRAVDRTRSPPTTTIDPGVYPMLWITSTVVKRWTHVWLPRENGAFPRPRKFTRCAVVAPADAGGVGLPAGAISTIRCDGAVPMVFAAVADSSGAIAVEQALVPKAGAAPAWSTAPASNDERWPVECASLEEPAIATETYFRDTVGMRTYP